MNALQSHTKDTPGSLVSWIDIVVVIKPTWVRPKDFLSWDYIEKLKVKLTGAPQIPTVKET